ncbi:hypothetical protein E6O75_ATG04654 [Venturia nashicola]|uniref:Uncharacterized protein n=1 Tax=Venturia nashicola TaxID=86259 RepID=A0A4Z1PHF0_9PEZI|nr:hypothetical protein E6O75_ATG04654 [Venturia nashicola]
MLAPCLPDDEAFGTDGNGEGMGEGEVACRLTAASELYHVDICQRNTDDSARKEAVGVLRIILKVGETPLNCDTNLVACWALVLELARTVIRFAMNLEDFQVLLKSMLVWSHSRFFSASNSELNLTTKVPSWMEAVMAVAR